MRTTVTLEPDLAAQLRQLAKDGDMSFKEAINSTLRRGLTARQTAAEPYTMPTYDMGLRPGIDLIKAGTLAAALEDEATVAKLELRK